MFIVQIDSAKGNVESKTYIIVTFIKLLYFSVATMTGTGVNHTYGLDLSSQSSLVIFTQRSGTWTWLFLRRLPLVLIIR